MVSNVKICWKYSIKRWSHGLLYRQLEIIVEVRLFENLLKLVLAYLNYIIIPKNILDVESNEQLKRVGWIISLFLENL